MLRRDLKAYMKFAENLANKSGKVINKHFRNLDGFMSKSDFSPVTRADTEAEALIRELIRKEYPAHGIVGEEFGEENKKSEFKWVIDPIDGTKSFLTGRPLFTTLISLVHKEQILVGLIDQPITKDRWVAGKGIKTTFNNKKVRTREITNIKDAIIATTDPNLLSKKILSKFNKLVDMSKYVIYGGDAYNYALLASGYIDIIIETGLKKHDFCALVNIVQEAGGIITNLSGEVLDYKSSGDLVVCANLSIHKQVMKIING